MLGKNTGNFEETIRNYKFRRLIVDSVNRLNITTIIQQGMIIYNVTINIHESVHDQWMTWMQEKHINDVLATGKFTSARMVKVLIEEEMGGVTYSIQYTTDNQELLQKYYKEDAPRLREEGAALFGDKMLAFRTELELISEH